MFMTIYVFIIHYLLTSKEIEISNEWISEKDISGGATFFRGPHEIPTKILCSRFKNDVSEFNAICEQAHGLPLNMADAAYGFRITPRIPVAVLHWKGDEDFPAETNIIYDKTISVHLATDIIWFIR